ncbi:MAG TPA: universal stress protein [Acidimicrobiia bacterium]|nr:universal stress protein [Acidimicrobiia bacterium]
MGRIVVGVDGSEASLAALAWAVEEARLRDATLDLVHAWTPFRFEPTGESLPVPEEELLEQSRVLLEDALARSGAREAGVDARCQAVVDGAAHALLEAAEGAELLVVGARGLGGFKSLLLGSVSQQVLQHAPCPVAVIR